MFAPGLEATIRKHTGWSAQFRSFSRYQRIGLCKSIHGLWHTGAQKVLYKMSKEGICPCCQSAEETTTHVLQCTSESTIAHRKQQFIRIEQQLGQ